MPDQLFVQWSKDTEYAGNAATLHVLVLHAMIVLLTYGEPKGELVRFVVSNPNQKELEIRSFKDSGQIYTVWASCNVLSAIKQL